jgi:flagellar biosynthesis chaperone FliJ
MKAKDKRKLNDLIDNLEAIRDEIEKLLSELQEEWDNKSEKWQESDKGSDAQYELDKIQELIDSLGYVDDGRPEED